MTECTNCQFVGGKRRGKKNYKLRLKGSATVVTSQLEQSSYTYIVSTGGKLRIKGSAIASKSIPVSGALTFTLKNDPFNLVNLLDFSASTFPLISSQVRPQHTDGSFPPRDGNGAFGKYDGPTYTWPYYYGTPGPIPVDNSLAESSKYGTDGTMSFVKGNVNVTLTSSTIEITSAYLDAQRSGTWVPQGGDNKFTINDTTPPAGSTLPELMNGGGSSGNPILPQSTFNSLAEQVADLGVFVRGGSLGTGIFVAIRQIGFTLVMPEVALLETFPGTKEFTSGFFGTSKLNLLNGFAYLIMAMDDGGSANDFINVISAKLSTSTDITENSPIVGSVTQNGNNIDLSITLTEMQGSFVISDKRTSSSAYGSITINIVVQGTITATIPGILP